MAIRKVARLGHPVLRAPTRDLTPEEIRSAPVRALIEDMVETMHEYGGVGLAAPQVHESLRLAVIEYEHGNRYGEQQPQPLMVMFNARVTVLDATPTGFWEGCLSVPGMRGFVERPGRVQVDYLDPEGEARQLVADGFLATVLQHELDHLDGVLYVDKIRDPTKFAFNEEYGRYHLEVEEADPPP